MADESQRIGDLLLMRQALERVSETPYLDCQLLLAFCLSVTREWLLAHSDDALTDIPHWQQKTRHFEALINRRALGEPLAYITGYKDFWDYRFKVTPETLIPRPETELLVETILNTLDEQHHTLLDLGTGSGAIAISLARERPAWHVTGVDINPGALCIARENAKGCRNLSWINGHWADAVAPATIDLIVCNPPYIADDDEHLKTLQFEPRQALVSAEAGYSDLRKVIHQASNIVATDGYLLLEHGFEQQQTVCELFQAQAFTAQPLHDLQGNPRAVLGQKTNLQGANVQHEQR